MATYAIGDIQGCFNSFKELLAKINFKPNSDTLWLTGDLVNRGPSSLKTLDFLLNEIPESNLITVLGNHDLYLITLYYKIFERDEYEHSLDEILDNPNAKLYIDWLRKKPLIHYDAGTNYALVHAGIEPSWEISKAIQLADEVTDKIKSNDSNEMCLFLENMFGDMPNKWHDSLDSFERLRFITNAFTRMRFLNKDGSLDFANKTSIQDTDKNLIPWFEFPQRKTKDIKIIFGHWAALKGVMHHNIFGIDSGCVWHNKLTAMCLDSNKLFHVSCKKL